MKLEPIVISETSAIRTQMPGNYPKRNKLHLEHGESLKTRLLYFSARLFLFLNLILKKIFLSEYVTLMLFPGGMLT